MASAETVVKSAVLRSSEPASVVMFEARALARPATRSKSSARASNGWLPRIERLELVSRSEAIVAARSPDNVAALRADVGGGPEAAAGPPGTQLDIADRGGREVQGADDLGPLAIDRREHRDGSQQQDRARSGQQDAHEAVGDEAPGDLAPPALPRRAARAGVGELPTGSEPARACADVMRAPTDPGAT